MKEIKFKKNKGFLGLLILGILIILGAGFIALLSNGQTAENLLKDGDIYNETTILKENQKLAVEINANTRALAKDDGTQFYIIETTDYKYIVLEVKEGDTRFDSEEGNDFEELPLLVATKVERWSTESATKWRNLVAKADWASDFESGYLLSIKGYEDEKFITPLVCAAVALAGVGLIVLAFVRRKKNGVAYEELLNIYPELRSDFTQLQRSDIFADDQIKVYIYKNHLVSLRAGLDTLDLSQVKWLDFSVYTVKNSSNGSFEYFTEGEKKKALNYGVYRNKDAQSIENLFNAIQTHFSHILLGAENKPEQLKASGASRQTIAEFIAQKEAQGQKTYQQESVQESSEEVVEDVTQEDEQEQTLVTTEENNEVEEETHE